MRDKTRINVSEHAAATAAQFALVANISIIAVTLQFKKNHISK